MKELNERLIEERNEINENIKELNNFISKNENYQKLTKMQQLLLIMQLRVMQTYSDLLQIRIIEIIE